MVRRGLTRQRPSSFGVFRRPDRSLPHSARASPPLEAPWHKNCLFSLRRVSKPDLDARVLDCRACHASTRSVDCESDRLRHAAPGHDADDGRGPDQRRRAGLQPDAGGHLPLAEHPEDLCLPRLHWHEPRPDGGLHRQPARAVLPVRRRHPGYQYAEHPAGRLVPSSRSSPAPTWARRWPRSWRCPTGRCRGCPRAPCRR